MPAPASSAVPAALEQLIRTQAPVPVADAVRLRVFLRRVPGPRDRRGRRYPLTALLAAMEHSGSVLAQRQVADRSNEISACAPLLDTLDPTGTVVTADALHTQHEHGAHLRSRGVHYRA